MTGERINGEVLLNSSHGKWVTSCGQFGQHMSTSTVDIEMLFTYMAGDINRERQSGTLHKRHTKIL